MSSEAKLSIIMPAYNAARTLHRAAESVLAQTIKAIELWIVDDGSIDGTGQIADDLLQHDERVKVIHQANQGSCLARLNALRQIDTEYFGFVDSDDKVEINMYERMLAIAEMHDLDVVQCNAPEMDRKDGVELFLSRESVVSNVVKPWLLEGRGPAYLWDKVFRRDCLNVEIDQSYKSSVFEDLILNMYFFQNVSRFGILHEQLYHYTQNDSSTTRRFNPKHLQGFVQTIALRHSLFATYDSNIDERMLAQWVVCNAANFIRLAGLGNDGIQNVESHLRTIVSLPEICSALKCSPQSRSKCMLELARISPKVVALYYFLRNHARRYLYG